MTNINVNQILCFIVILLLIYLIYKQTKRNSLNKDIIENFFYNPRLLINPPESQRVYSSIWDKNRIGTGHATSKINSGQAWSANTRIDRGPHWMAVYTRPINLEAIVIQGRASSNQYVKRAEYYVHNGTKWKKLNRTDYHIRRNNLNSSNVLGDNLFVGNPTTKQANRKTFIKLKNTSICYGVAVKILEHNSHPSMRLGLYGTQNDTNKPAMYFKANSSNDFTNNLIQILPQEKAQSSNWIGRNYNDKLHFIYLPIGNKLKIFQHSNKGGWSSTYPSSSQDLKNSNFITLPRGRRDQASSYELTYTDISSAAVTAVTREFNSAGIFG